jgi:hypothetical protein
MNPKIRYEDYANIHESKLSTSIKRFNFYIRNYLFGGKIYIYIYIHITSISQEKEIHQGIIYFAWIKQIGASNNENLLHVNKYFHFPRG